MTAQKKNKNNTPRALFMVTQRAVLYHQDTKKYCIAKVANLKGSFAKKYGPWDLFGGHIEADERVPEDSLRREIQEEAGITPKAIDVLSTRDFSGYGVGAERQGRRILIGYLAYSSTQEITLSHEHQEYAWMSASEIMDHQDIGQWIKDLIQQAQRRIAQQESKDAMLRILAEFDNYKKRSKQQQEEFTKYASEKVITDLLPILDNFYAATQHIPKDQADSPWLTGIMYIQKQMEDVFGDAGVQALDISVGDAFDPQTMEAIKSTASKASPNQQEKAQKQNVTKVVQKGYMIKDRLLRPARVEV